MENEMIDVNQESKGLMMARDPQVVLAEAKKAATALMQVVSQKKKPVIMNGEQYLEFEDWQTLGRFYGLAVRVTSTTFLDMGGVKGWEAYADVIRISDGAIISSANAMCLNDEEKWSTRTKFEYINNVKTKVGDVPVPLFQLRSMAQTRACAKAFRNVLAWVAVLAGFKPTPAEEMTDGLVTPQSTKPPVDMPKAKVEPTVEPTKEPTATTGPVISERQAGRLYAIAASNGKSKEDVHEYLDAFYWIDSASKIAKANYEDIVLHFQTKKTQDE